MKDYRLPSNLITLTQQACWKAFWFRRSLEVFLRSNGISQGILNTWREGEPKIEFLSRLFYELSGVNLKAAHDSVLSMAKALCAMKTFPDHEKRPERASAVGEAVMAINALRPEFEKYMNSLSKAEQKASAAQLHEALERRIAEDAEARKKAEEEFAALMVRLNDLAQHVGEQEYGYKFEPWIRDIARLYDLDARGAFRGGEDSHQIDGAITIEGTTLLVEAKLTREPTDRNDVTLFKDKIESRAENTRGLLVSMSGFTDRAKVDASGRHSTIIMMDHSHLFGLIASKRYTFPELLTRMLQNSAQTGSAYLDVRDC